MKILGGLYTTGGVHTHTLCTRVLNETNDNDKPRFIK